MILSPDGCNNLAGKMLQAAGQPEAGCRAVLAQSWASLLCAGLALPSLARYDGGDASKRQSRRRLWDPGSVPSLCTFSISFGSGIELGGLSCLVRGV